MIKFFASLLIHAAFLLFFGLAFSQTLIAQTDSQPYFRNYSTDDGLPSPEVHDIIQDRQGYIWIATDSGVSRFDGYKFKNFGAKEGLINNVVFYLEEDEEGKIWMQTMSGNMYYAEGDSIHAYAYNDLFQQYRSFLPNGFLISDGEWSYFSLIHLGIMKVNKKGDHEFINQTNPSMLVLLENPKLKHSLFSIVGNTTLQRFGFPINTSITDHQLAVYADSLSHQYGIYLQPGSTRSSGFSDFTHQLFDLRQELGIFYKHQLKKRFQLPAKAAEIDKIDSTFWVGLNHKEGAWAFSNFSDLCEQEYKRYLFGNSISAIYKDKLGGHWFGTLENGIYYAPNLQLEVISSKDLYLKDRILSLHSNTSGQLLAGTSKGHLYLLNPGRSVKKILSVDGGIFDFKFVDQSPSIWLSGQPLRVYQAGKIKTFSYTPGVRPSHSISTKKFLPSKDGKVIYCLSSIGMEIVDRKREEVVYSTFGSSNQMPFLTAFEDYRKRLWIGTANGLFEFKDGQLLPPPVDHPVFQIRIEALDQTKDSTLVLGTKGSGLVLWKDSTINILDEGNGLTSNMVENILIDPQQRIWAGTPNGLNIMQENEKTGEWSIRQVSMAHGLPSNEIHDLYYLEGWIYVATAAGLVRLPLNEKKTPKIPLPLMEKILVNGQSVPIGELNDLKHHERNIQLHFVGLNFKFKGNIPYRYRLNSNINWSYTYDRSVNYAALEPGNYIFELQAQNEDGLWSSSAFTTFNISPPFWQYWWFRLGLIGSALSLIFYWYRLRLSRIKKAAATEKQINNLQRSALQAQMSPHFIFNCLASIQQFIASGDKSNAMTYLSRFANLVRTTLNASTQFSVSLEEEIQVLENYLELEKLRLGNKFEYQIELDPTIDTFEVSVPPLLVQPFVENAITNSFAVEDPSQVGRIKIIYRQINGYLHVAIRDNGSGFKHASSQKKAYNHPLSGIDITQKRLSLQDTFQKDQIQIEELTNDTREKIGTEVMIRIKL